MTSIGISFQYPWVTGSNKTDVIPTAIYDGSGIAFVNVALSDFM